ncbi:hypothetical protein llap_10478 [Limosa lapponica baueri]|uniref:Rna-directed dna polymerase from mobile element jockey-like n=1 Tax=Limosa lapponica baueri TaxID=1758121 RepID=A0A2I0TZU1_LIMLA|nr:hypothetical protein llap_10478 [Limosa lapponica baueri]
MNHNSLGTAIQPVFYPVKSTLVYAMIRQLLQENPVGDSVKGLTKVQVDNVHSVPPIQKAGHMVIERDQANRYWDCSETGIRHVQGLRDLPGNLRHGSS